MAKPQLESSPHRVIRASAGSGKTYTLSNHYLHLLYRGAQPGEILATTFTRKAAGEILGRVLTRLAQAAADAQGAYQLAEALKEPGLDLARARRLLEVLTGSIHRVAVSTLDSFFHRMAGCFRFELGLPRQVRVVDENHPLVRQLRREAIDAMLGDEDLEVMIGLLRRLHHDAAQRRITDAIDEVVRELYAVYRQTDAPAWRWLEPPPTLDSEQLAQACQLLEEAQTLLPEDKRWFKAWQSDLDAARRSDWEDFLKGGIAGCIAAGKEEYGKKPISSELMEAYRPMVAHARAAIVRRVIDQTQATRQLLERFDAHYSRLRREHGVMLFSDVPWLLSRWVPSLAADGDIGLDALYYRLDSRVQHLLLDEFQDTSPVQWRILLPFAQEILAGEGSARDGAPARSFFCVGDVKQAIYGWRGGCAEIFEQVINDLSLPDQSLGTLRTSYRTSPVVLEVVNEVFEGIADLPPVAELQPHVAAWARGFQEHRAQYADRPGYVELVASPTPARGQDPGAAYLDFVADQVAELARRYRGHNLGVLVRTNRTADRVLQCLRQRGVAASGEGGAALTSDAAVELILSALRLADHPGHTAAAFHVLHSPLAELLGLELLEAGHVAKVARSIRRSLIDEGYAATLTRWARHLADRCNARSVGRLTQLIELAQQYDPALTLRADDFVRFVESAQVEDPTPAPVRVMTVHRAKGLEFDAVVLAELSDLIGQTARLMLWRYRPHPTAPSQAVFRSVSQEMRAVLEAYDPIVARAHEQEVGRRVADDLSALYVAMTRPRYALHMIVEPLRLTKSGWGRPGLSNASPAAILRHALTDVSDPLPEGVLYRLGDPDWSRRVEAPAQAEVEPAAVPLVRLIKDEQASRSWATVTPSSLEGGGVIDAADLLELEVSASRRRGTLWHAWLAQVGFVDEPQGVPEDQVLMDVGRPLWPEAELAEQIERFRAALARPKVQQVLRRNGAAELWRERPFAVHERGKLIQGIFDRAVLWRENGQTESVLLIDFKTDAVEQSEFLDAAVERYRPQLDAYRRALGRMLRLKESSIRACLVFLMAGAVVEV